MEGVKRRKGERVKEWLFGRRSRSSSSVSSKTSTSRQSSFNDPKLQEPSDKESIVSSCLALVSSQSDLELSIDQEPTARAEETKLEGAQDGHHKHGPASHSNTSQDLWEMARQKLSEEERFLLAANIQIGPTQDILIQVEDVVAEKQQLVEERTWKLDFGGRKIVLRDVVSKIAGWVTTFKDVGETVASLDPVHCALPWAAVKLVLSVATADIEQAGQVLVGVELVTCLINRGKIYERLYIKQNPATSEDAMDDLQKTLVLTYKCVLSFLVAYIQLMEKNTFKRTLGAMIDPGMLADMMADLGKYETRCEVAANNCERQISSLSRSRQDATQHELQEMLKGHIRKVDARASKYWRKLEDDERCKILRWISEVPFETDHYNAIKGRVEGTGQWLLAHETYQEWRSKELSTILWLNGIPGAGKTKLSSKVIDDILQNLTDTQINEAFAYFYCDRNRTDHRDPVIVLRSLVRQFSASQDESTIIPYVESKYTERKRSGFSRDQLTSEECQELLLRLTRDYSQCSIVIDGLDECDRDTRCVLMDVLDTIVAKSIYPVKIYIASRKDQDLRDRYQTGEHLEVTANDNQADIEKFVLSKLDQSPFCRTKMSKRVRETVLRTFQDKSQGMFQWAALHIDELLKLNRNKDILSYVDKLPKGLEAAYERIYEDIASQNGSKRDVAFAAFKILMCSWRSLSPAEMVIAATQEIDEDFHVEQDIDIEYVLDACRNFMVVADGMPERRRENDPVEGDEQEEGRYSDAPHSKYRVKQILDGTDMGHARSDNAICRFSHLSVREYLELHHWSIAEVNAYVACLCLRTLLQLRWNEHLAEPNGEHLAESDNGSGTDDEVDCPLLRVKTVDKRNLSLLYWVDESDGSSNKPQDVERSPSEGDDTEPPPFTCILEFCNVHQHDEEASVCSSVPYETHIADHHGSPLERWTRYASEAWSLHVRRAERHETLRQKLDALLTEFLGEPRSSSLRYRAWTIFNTGNENLTMEEPERSRTKMVFNQGYGLSIGDPDLEHSFSSTFSRNLLRPTNDAALGCALLGLGHTLNAWIESGTVDVNHKNARGDRLLNLAVEGNHYGLCETLLRHGADPDVLNSEHSSPMQAAILHHCPEIVELLLKHGANPNLAPSWQADGHFKCYPLRLAVMLGEYKITKLLLDNGADLLKSKVLRVAGRAGDIKTTRLLLDSLRDLEAATEDEEKISTIRESIEKAWTSALQNENQNPDVLNLFLDKGIDFAAMESMHVAAAAQRLQNVRWLLSHGLDINQKSELRYYRDTPLLAMIRGADSSVRGGTVQATRDLVSQGADIEATDRDGFTALHLAIDQERDKLAEYLMDIKADVATRNKAGATALCTACRYSSSNIVSKLLDLGSDVNQGAGPDGDYEFPLFTAYTRSSTWSVATITMSLLLEAGAKYKVEDFTEEQRRSWGMDRLQALEKRAAALMPSLWKKSEVSFVPWRLDGPPDGPPPEAGEVNIIEARYPSFDEESSKDEQG